jgi:hypothetical protein
MVQDEKKTIGNVNVRKQTYMNMNIKALFVLHCVLPFNIIFFFSIHYYFFNDREFLNPMENKIISFVLSLMNIETELTEVQ